MSVLCVKPAGNWTSAKAICSVPTHDLLSRSTISALLTLQLTNYTTTLLLTTTVVEN